MSLSLSIIYSTFHYYQHGSEPGQTTTVNYISYSHTSNINKTNETQAHIKTLPYFQYDTHFSVVSITCNNTSISISTHNSDANGVHPLSPPKQNPV